MKYISLVGPHCAGKSTLTDRVRDALCAEGVPVFAFHHVTPASADPVLGALEYAAQRRRLVTDPAPTVGIIVAPQTLGGRPAEVVICDRWCADTSALAWALHVHGPARDGNALSALGNAELAWLPPTDYILLDAPDSVLDARAKDRGVETTAIERSERSEIRRLALYKHWPTIDTSAPVEETVTRLVGVVRGMLG